MMVMRTSALQRRSTAPAMAAILLTLCVVISGVDKSMAQPATAGDAAFATCLACHAVGAGAKAKNGPVLNGIAGKAAGADASFTYSDAFQAAKAAGLIWTDANLDRYLADPIAFMPGNRMAYAVPDATERAAIISYLKSLP